MVKIITPGKKKEEDPIYFKCSKCDCVFTAEEEDVGMDKISDAIIVSIDYNESDGMGVLFVGRRRRGGIIDIINTFSGNEALELYKKLVMVKENNK